MSFIEELFYGNLDPQSRSPHSTRRVSHDVAALDELEGAAHRTASGYTQATVCKTCFQACKLNGQICKTKLCPMP